MPFGRSHARSKSRSPAPGSSFPTAIPVSPSRPPTFLPPSHYAAAAGLKYEPPSRSPHPPSETNETHSSSQLGRLLGRASSKRSSPRPDSAFEEKDAQGRRQSQLGNIPMLEAQLLPSLRDTVDRMTQLPQPQTRSDHSDPYNCHSIHPSQSISFHKRQEDILTPSTPHHKAAISRITPDPGSNTGIPRLSNVASSAPKSALKSPARRSVFTHTPASSPLTPKPVRTTRSDKADVLSEAAHYASDTSSDPKPREDSSRAGKLPPKTAASIAKPSSLSKLRAEYRSRSNPGTPQQSQNLGFSTPQPGRPAVSPLPQSSLPRPRISRPIHLPPSDSGSEIERRVSLRHSPGRLVVTNAVIVPSSSESDHAMKTRNRRSQWISAKDVPAIPPPPPDAFRSHSKSTARQRLYRDAAVVPVDRKPSAVGLGLDVGDIHLGRRQGKPLVESDDESISIYEDRLSDHSLLTDEPVLVSSEDDDESIYGEDHPPRACSSLSSRGAEEGVRERQKEALLGLVDGLHREFGRPRSSGARSSMTHSESDVDYSAQGVAISGSAEFQGAPGSRDLRANRYSAAREWDEESAYSDDDIRDTKHLNPRWIAQDYASSDTKRHSRTSLSNYRNSWKRSSSALGVRESPHREKPSSGHLGSGERRRSVSPVSAPVSPRPRSPRTSVRSASPLPASITSASGSVARAGGSFEESSRRRTKHLDNRDNPHGRVSRASRVMSGSCEKNGLDVPRKPDDAGLRERLAFGIPESLSYCGNNVTPDEEPSLRPPLSRLGSVWSACSRPGLPRAESDLSVAENQWEQSRFSKELSRGAAALFENLTSKAVRFMDDGRGQRLLPDSDYLQDRTPVAEPSSWISGNTQAPSRSPLVAPDRPRRRSLDSASLASDSSSPTSVYEEPPSPQRHEDVDNQSGPPLASSHELPEVPNTWRSSITPHVYQALSKHYGLTEMERQELIHDLFISEKTFVKSSRHVIRAYFLPLRVRDSRTWLPGLPPDVSRLFDWLEDIVNLHAAIARALATVVAIWKTGSIVQRVAGTLRVFVPQLEVYMPYLVKLDAVREVVGCHADKDGGEFGEYLRMKARERRAPADERGECQWTLEKLFDEPRLRLRKYVEVFQRLGELTPREHPDHLATVSLLYATRMAVRVMNEVKVREDEYDFVKDLASRIDGLSDVTPLARRARRLLWYGALLQPGISAASTPGGKGPRPSESQNSLKRQPAQRMSKLVTAVRHWDSRRSRAGSISSSASSTLSVRSYDSSPSTSSASILVTPRSDRFSGIGFRARSGSLAKPLVTKAETTTTSARMDERLRDGEDDRGRMLNVMVFSDLIVLAAPKTESTGEQRTPEREQRCMLMDDIGLSRVLEFSEFGEDVTLSLVSISPEYLDTGLMAEDTAVRSMTLMFSATQDDGGDREAFLGALRKCQRHTTRALSFPSLPGSMIEDLELDTRHSLVGILSSGLPLPKSPSIQFDEATRGQRREAADGEREERGWWTLRFQQVLRELQREDVDVPVMGHA